MKLQKKKTRGKGKENVQPAQRKTIELAAKAYIDHVRKAMPTRVGEAGKESEESDSLSSIIFTLDN